MPGGHVVQIEKNRRAPSTATGLEVGCDYTDQPDLTGVDLVHGFGLSPTEIRRCHTRRVPVVLSTIYWDRSYRSEGADHRPGPRVVAGRVSRATHFARAAFRGRAALVDAGLEVRPTSGSWPGPTSQPTSSFPMPGARRPASGATSGCRRRWSPSPTASIPRASLRRRGPSPTVATYSSSAGSTRTRTSWGPSGPCGERSPDGHRRRSTIPITRSTPPSAARRGAGWVTFAGRVPHDSAELSALYHGARVHVLPSWFETTGLVSLEAALSGCSVVSTERGHAREYLDDLAWYCDPGDRDRSRDAVWNGWRSPPQPALRQRVLDRYTWDHVAEATAAAYRTVLQPSPQRNGRRLAAKRRLGERPLRRRFASREHDRTEPVDVAPVAVIGRRVEVPGNDRARWRPEGLVTSEPVDRGVVRRSPPCGRRAALSSCRVRRAVTEQRAGGPTSATPFWFGPSDRPLFGWLHLPAGGRARGGVVLCQPLGIEAICVYFSYPHPGRPPGPAGPGRAPLRLRRNRRLQWRGDGPRPARRLAGEHDRSHRIPGGTGVGALGLVGIRMGALFAATEAARWGSVDALVLWDPCLSGRGVPARAALPPIAHHRGRRPEGGGRRGPRAPVRSGDGQGAWPTWTSPARPARSPDDTIVLAPPGGPDHAGSRPVWPAPRR